MKKGYCTIYSDLHEEVAWRELDGSPVIYATIHGANKEITDGMLMYDIELMADIREEDEIPDSDVVAWVEQIDETRYQIKDLDRNNLFVWDITKL